MSTGNESRPQKRIAGEDKSSTKNDPDSINDDHNELGPILPNPNDSQPKRLNKRHKYIHDSLHLDSLPNTDMYEISLMHRDVVNFVAVTRTDFVITTSIDGHVKFWKKTEKGIEFVKHFKAHLAAVVAISVSYDGLYLATIGADKGMKVFDIVNFDMINMFKLDFPPNAITWAYQKGQSQALLLCSELETKNIHIFDGRGDVKELKIIDGIHSHPVHIMKYNHIADTIVSVDQGGFVEYWSPRLEEERGFVSPSEEYISWKFKSETDLYDFKKARVVPTTLEFSPNGDKFATFGFGDRQVRIFSFKTGKLLKKYDESITTITEMQQAGTAVTHLDDMEFGRRLAVEKEIESVQGGQSSTVNVVFDESGNFILYSTPLGIKVVNIHTSRVVRLIGKSETQRFMNISLYQGAPKKKAIVTLAMAASDNPVYKESEKGDPTLFVTSFKKNRFYAFTRREPDSEDSVIPNASSRDIFNEKPSREEQTVAAAQSLQQTQGTTGIIHTTFGDIHFRLFPEYAPKAVENFIELSKRGYYDNVIFHRVIKGFMIQTGDPLGDGTGGISCWGREFEDEFHPALRHDRAYTISMANAGPNTNGSQFFITVAPTAWLDDKHTIFGRATGGMDVIHRIEKVKTDKLDKPYDPVKIMSVEIR